MRVLNDGAGGLLHIASFRRTSYTQHGGAHPIRLVSTEHAEHLEALRNLCRNNAALGHRCVQSDSKALLPERDRTFWSSAGVLGVMKANI